MIARAAVDFPWDGLWSAGFISMIAVSGAVFLIRAGGWAGAFYVYVNVPFYRWADGCSVDCMPGMMILLFGLFSYDGRSAGVFGGCEFGTLCVFGVQDFD